MRAAASFIGLAMLLIACGAEPSPTPSVPCPTEAPTTVSAQATLDDAATATVVVSGAVEGEFAFELYGDEAPIATANFVALARCGFYSGIWFHRVLSGFVIQAGDPGTRTHDGDFAELGRGGAGYEYEIEPPADGLDYVPYAVAVANDTRTNDSQFFITLSDLSGRLPRNYTIFGQVVGGTDVIDEIAALPVNDPQLGVPLEQVTIDSVTISPDAEG